MLKDVCSDWHHDLVIVEVPDEAIKFESAKDGNTDGSNERAGHSRDHQAAC
jgi:hypothetical protein